MQSFRFITLLCSMFVFQFPFCFGSGALLPSGYLSTNGNQLVSQGNKVLLSGVNWWGAESECLPYGLWLVTYKQVLDKIKSMGFNHVRFTWGDHCLFKRDTSTWALTGAVNPDLVGITPLQAWDKIISYAGYIGLKVVMSRMWQTSDGGQTDLWYDTSGFYSSDQVTKDLVTVAQHYANNPTVIGIEVNNEIGWTVSHGDKNSGTDVLMWWTNVGNAIQAVNPDILVIFQGIQDVEFAQVDLSFIATNPVRLNVPNKIVYSVHAYPPWSDQFPENSDVWNRGFGFIYSQNIAPIWVSEFGIQNDNADASDRQWFQSWMAYMTGASALTVKPGDFALSWSYFAIDATGPNSGTSDPDNGGFSLLMTDYKTIIHSAYDPLVPALFQGIPCSLLPTASNGCPNGYTCIDIGTVGTAGGQSVSSNCSQITISGSGADLWGNIDAGHFMFKSLTNGGSMKILVYNIQNTNSWAKVGVMFRASTSKKSIHYSLFATPDNGLNVQYRDTANGISTELSQYFNSKFPVYLQVARTGNVFGAYYSTDGSNWSQMPGSFHTMNNFPATALVGVAITSHADPTVTKAVFGLNSLSQQSSGTTISLAISPNSNKRDVNAPDLQQVLANITSQPAYRFEILNITENIDVLVKDYYGMESSQYVTQQLIHTPPSIWQVHGFTLVSKLESSAIPISSLTIGLFVICSIIMASI